MCTTAKICVFTDFTFSYFQLFSHFTAFFASLNTSFSSSGHFVCLQRYRCYVDILIQQTCPRFKHFFFLYFIFFLASDERAVKIFTENNFCTADESWSESCICLSLDAESFFPHPLLLVTLQPLWLKCIVLHLPSYTKMLFMGGWI